MTFNRSGLIITLLVVLSLCMTRASAQDKLAMTSIQEELSRYRDAAISRAEALDSLLAVVDRADRSQLKEHWRELIGIALSDQEHVLAREVVLHKLLELSPTDELRTQVITEVNRLLAQLGAQPTATAPSNGYQVVTSLFVWYISTSQEIDQAGLDAIRNALLTYINLGHLNPESLGEIVEPAIQRLHAAQIDTSDLVIACVTRYGRIYNIIGSPLVYMINTGELDTLRKLVSSAPLSDENYPYGAAALIADLGETWFVDYADSVIQKTSDKILLKRIVGLKQYAEAQNMPGGIVAWLADGRARNAHDFRWAVVKAVRSSAEIEDIRDAVQSAIRHAESRVSEHPAPVVALAAFVGPAKGVLRQHHILSEQELLQYQIIK